MNNLQIKLEKLANEATKELNVIGLSTGKVRRYSVSDTQRRWGDCRRTVDEFSIRISRRLMENGSDTDIKNVLIHELIHTMPYCLNHGTEFKRKANLVNSAYPQYHIKRTDGYNDFENGDALLGDKVQSAKYVLKCTCGATAMFHRKCRTIDIVMSGYKDGYWVSCTKCGKKNNWKLIVSK